MRRDDDDLRPAEGLVYGVLIALAFWVIGFLVLYAVEASAHYTDGCRKAHCKRHVIRPYRASFLGPVGACESGTGSYSLRAGLRAYNPGGPFYGRYQFEWRGWLGAGGRGDPMRASWTEQAYRAVVWLHRNGRSSWPNC